MEKPRLLPALALLILAGCAIPPTPEVIPPVPLPRVDVQEMNVSFDFPESLTLRTSAGESLLANEHTSIQIQTLPLRDKAPPNKIGEVPEWILPPAIARAVQDERSCSPLKSSSVVLPVDTVAPLLCDLVLDPSGRVVVWMVGLGRPFHDATFLQSSFLVLEKENVHIFWYILPFPEGDATVQWLSETFKDRHPGLAPLIWTNRSFAVHSEEVRRTLMKQIDPPSAEVQDAMTALESLAFSVGPSRALMGQ